VFLGFFVLKAFSEKRKKAQLNATFSAQIGAQIFEGILKCF
jgi:hypothetical protein